MRDGRKKQARSNKKTRQSNTAHPIKAVTFPKKNELPRVGLEPTTLYTLDKVLLPTCTFKKCSTILEQEHNTTWLHLNMISCIM